MRDINIEVNGFSIAGKEILRKTNIIISSGVRYGFIGNNGVGKSTILNFIYKNDKLSDIDTYLVSQEICISSDKTIFQNVIESNVELLKYHNRYNELCSFEILTTEEEKELQKVSEKLGELNYEKESAFVKKILMGLGIDQESLNCNIDKFSGGWKMRIALASALYRQPELLLLDEVSNHLDLEGCIWLSEYLKNYKGTVICISHDIEFLDLVCNYIMNLENYTITYYKGNYYNFKKQYEQNIKNFTSINDKIEKKIKELKKGGAKTKQELENYINKNPLHIIPYNKNIHYNFGEIPDGYKNLITLNSCSFSYDDKTILKSIDFNVSMMSRVVLVGANGSGKSTLMKILKDELKPSKGEYNFDERIRIGYYNQHTIEEFPLETNPVDWLKNKYNLKEDILRSWLGKSGLEGSIHKIPIKNLSGGQKVKLALVDLQLLKPHILLLDEPSNHLDINTLEALKEGINNFNGGVVIISHNIDLITQTNCDVWELSNGNCIKTTFEDYASNFIKMKILQQKLLYK